MEKEKGAENTVSGMRKRVIEEMPKIIKPQEGPQTAFL